MVLHVLASADWVFIAAILVTMASGARQTITPVAACLKMEGLAVDAVLLVVVVIGLKEVWDLLPR